MQTESKTTSSMTISNRTIDSTQRNAVMSKYVPTVTNPDLLHTKYIPKASQNGSPNARITSTQQPYGTSTLKPSKNFPKTDLNSSAWFENPNRLDRKNSKSSVNGTRAINQSNQNQKYNTLDISNKLQNKEQLLVNSSHGSSIVRPQKIGKQKSAFAIARDRIRETKDKAMRTNNSTRIGLSYILI